MKKLELNKITEDTVLATLISKDHTDDLRSIFLLHPISPPGGEATSKKSNMSSEMDIRLDHFVNLSQLSKELQQHIRKELGLITTKK